MQYFIQSIRYRPEAIRTILILDTSETMKGAPFTAARRAAGRFIDAKRNQDQISILATKDNKDGYELVSNYERDPRTLGNRIADLSANSKNTRLFDAIAAALTLAAGSGAADAWVGESNYIASTSIVIFSDGKDEGSAVSRNDLMTRISTLRIPVPIYSLAYTKIDPIYLRDMQALSKNSFGKYYHIGESYGKMTRSVEDIQNILQNDYVLTFRSYVPTDGKDHIMKLGVEYPRGSGKVRYQSARFEAITPPPVGKILEMQKFLDSKLKKLPSNEIFYTNPYSPVAGIIPNKQ